MNETRCTCGEAGDVTGSDELVAVGAGEGDHTAEPGAVRARGQVPRHVRPPMYKSNMAENPEKQTDWKCRLDQYPQMILNPFSQDYRVVCTLP